jgi:hypothetical protein
VPNEIGRQEVPLVGKVVQDTAELDEAPLAGYIAQNGADCGDLPLLRYRQRRPIRRCIRRRLLGNG